MVTRSLDPGTVDLWSFRALPQADDESVLSVDEIERARRFQHERDRQRFVAARAGLRRILSQYTDIAPAALTFQYGSNGKPFIFGGPCFNLSHTLDLAVVAVAGFPVGVDIESLRPMSEDVAEHFFALDEAEALRALPLEQRERGFFACWTAKEAFIKATGHGLSMPLDSFSVKVDLDRPPALVRIATAPSQTARWHLHRFALSDTVLGTLAARDWSGKLRHYDMLAAYDDQHGDSGNGSASSNHPVGL